MAIEVRKKVYSDRDYEGGAAVGRGGGKVAEQRLGGAAERRPGR